MKLSYDLHIHSALSPCGDNDMTPNNIANMAIIKGLDMIALTDHNSCGNLRALTEAAGDRLLVIPGIEVETSEDVHVACYFPTIEKAEKMAAEVMQRLPKIKNDSAIFGNQYYMDSYDEVISEEEILLVNAADMDIYEVFAMAAELGGAAVPAHIDRTSYSVLSNLGFIPPDLPVTSVEITSTNLDRMKNEYSQYNILTNSDAHYLENISEPENFIDLPGKNAQFLIDFLCKR